MIFKKKMICCFKCDKEYPDSYECCPICYPSDIELTATNLTVMVIIITILGTIVYYLW